MSGRRKIGLLAAGTAAVAAALSVVPVSSSAAAPPHAHPAATSSSASDHHGGTASECRAGASAFGRGCTHGPDAAPSNVSLARDGLAETATDPTGTSTGGAVPCYGDGTSGKRVQAVYAHAPDVPSRYAEAVPQIRAWAAAVDRIFADSAAETGGVRHVRWVTQSDCALDVVHLTMASSTDDDSYAATVNALAAKGHARTDRKYVVWTDAGLYCGIADFVDDDTAASRNANNSGPSYARVDRGCWGLTNSVEAHELMHTLGGVQYSAPHSSSSGHCLDENDRMCYQDSIYVSTTSVCDPSHERLFDCGHDDYFSTAPPTGSYLSVKWNAANSAFLATAEPGATTTTKARPARKG